ncbi:lysoplasmalogenase family protein [Nocardioides bigeumensis]
MVSDGLIGLKMFVLRRPRPGLDGAVMATYTAAQWGIRRGWTTEAAPA